MQGMLNDPLFAMHRQQMQQMNNMFMDPFGGMMGSPFLALPDAGRPGQQRDRQRRGERHNQLMPTDPFGHQQMFGNMFGNMHHMMNGMMGNMHTQMAQVQRMPQGADGGHFYSHSSVMSYSNDGSGGQPKVYQATSTTTQAPGGLKETRKSMRDSERGIERMSVGRHIHDRAHVMTKERDRGTDSVNEEEELVNLDDTEKDGFDREWRERTRPYSGRHHRAVDRRREHGEGGHRYNHHHHARRPHHQRSHATTQPAIEYPGQQH